MRLERNKNHYILALNDINNDGLNEILFIVINEDVENEHGFELQINVFQYHPPENKSDIGRKENWSLIGNLKAFGHAVSPKIEIGKGFIHVKVHFRGFYHEWHYIDGEFIDKGDD